MDKHFDGSTKCRHSIHQRIRPPVGFYAEFIKIANEADARNMSAEQLIVAMMTSRCPGENLKMELLKNKLTVDDVYDKAPRTSKDILTRTS